MFELEEYIDDIKIKISKLPNFRKSTIETFLKLLGSANQRRREKIIEKINRLVDPAYTKHILNSISPVLSFPSREESKGDGYETGQVCAGDQVLYPYELTRVNLTENIFGVGRAGSGKSTFIVYFVDQLYHHKIKCTVIDWKNDYTFLAKKYSDFSLLKWNQIAFNPLTNIPPGMDRILWWFTVLDVLAHSTGLYVATPSHILEGLEEIYQEKNGRITCKDLYQYLKSQNETKKRSEYNDVALNRLFLLNKILDPVINVDYGFDIEALFDSSCIIQMSPLHHSVSSFLFQTLAMWEYYRRLYNNIRADWKSAPEEYFLENFHMFIMDEAHLTQYSGQEANDLTYFSPPPLTIFFSQSRELGLATCAFTQFPHLVMGAFKTNAGTKMIGNIIESDVRRDLAASLGLDRNQEGLLGKLEKGMWIVSVAGRTKKPFLLKTPMVEKPIVAEAEVFQNSKQFLTGLQMKRQEIESRMFMTHVEKKSDTAHLPELSKEAWLLLDFIFQNEWKYQQQITEALGFSDRKFAKAKQMLLDKKLIKIEKFPVKVHDRIYFSLTANALDVMRTLGKNPQRIGYWKWISTVPGFEHHFWQNLLRVKHRILGWKGRLEYDLKDGRRVDLLEERNDGFRKAIEIELSTKDVENKTRVLTDREVDELVLLYRDESLLRFAKSKLEKMENITKEKIWIGLIRDYVEILDDIIKGAETSQIDGKSEETISDSDQNRKSDGNIGEVS